MKKNLLDYVKKYSLIPEQICDKSVNELKECEWHEHTFYDVITGEFVNRSGDRELSISYDNISTNNILMDIKAKAISKYLQDVKPVGWSGVSSRSGIRYNKYDVEDVMAIHVDHIHSMFDGKHKGIPVLTILSSLNDNYTGGEFIMFEDTLIKMNKGDILVFPSIFLYPHKVLPVKSGTRYTCVSWAW